jgi:kynurenine formamidase
MARTPVGTGSITGTGPKQPSSSVSEMAAIPSFDELPILADLQLRHSWGVFGGDDELGTLNRLTDEIVVRAASEVRTGERYGLNLELHEPDPPLFSRRPFEHEIFALHRNGWDDRLHDFSLQSSTQWDGFRHIRCREFGFYGGVTDDPQVGHPRLGIHHWSRRGIVGRGVLLDVGRHAGLNSTFDPLAGQRIAASQLEDIADQQGVEIEEGDILCIRFGWLSSYRRLSTSERAEMAATRPTFSGLASDEAMARRLWDWGISALACDNPAVESSPGDPSEGSLHRRVLPCLGMVLGELFDFDALATACAQDGRYTFLFTAAPLPLVGGIGSPANAIAIR